MSSGYTNECNVVTIFEMGVSCLTVNPSSNSSSDGAASLLITGGTPPYTITWSNGNTNQNIYNLASGSYSAVVVDSFGDFTATTTCILSYSNTEVVTISNTEETSIIEEEPLILSDKKEILSTSEESLNFTYSINHPKCGCDGGLVISASGGYPPYQYSLTNNTSIQSFPIYENLCQGNYLVYVTDSSGNSVSNSFVLNPPSLPTTYSISLNTTSNILVNTPTSFIKTYTTTFVVNPTLPEGVTITFDFSHLNVSRFSPNWNVSTNESTSTFTKNGSEIPLSFTSSSTGSSVNQNPGCQLETIYTSSLTESWSTITLTSSDMMSVTTLSSVQKLEDINCYLSDSIDTFYISNSKITGCDCCNLINSTS